MSLSRRFLNEVVEQDLLHLNNSDGYPEDDEDIFYGGIDVPVDPPKPGEVWYHGTNHNTSRVGAISWWTRSQGDAEFYADPEDGTTYTATVLPGRYGGYKDLVMAVRATGATRSEIAHNSVFDGTNDNDFVYIPKVQKWLRSRGFDGILLSDGMSNYEIDVLVVLNPRVIKATGNAQRTERL